MAEEKERKPKPGWKEWSPPAKKKPWHRWPWTGWTGKTLWDWQALLIVPVAIVAIASLLALIQSTRQQTVENERAEAVSLQAYLNQMGTLLIEEDLRTTEDVDVRNLARARTLTTLDGLNADRKRRVLRFLEETGLLRASVQEGQSVSDCPQDKLPVIPHDEQPVVSLMYARLEGVEIGREGLLGGIDLDHTNLANADIRDANLNNTSLRGANLFEARLSHTNLTNVDLRGACLSNAWLRGANLRDANVTQEQLDQAASLAGAVMPDGSKHL